MAKIVLSKANTGRPYVVLQGREYDGGILHVQFQGHEGNRKYGAAFNVKVDAGVLGYAEKNKKRENKSLAATGAVYCEMQARPRQDTVHFQVVDGRANRSYGLAFDVPREGNEELWVYLAESIIFQQ